MTHAALVLFANLLLAHLVGDFFLQNKWMLEGKRDRRFRSGGLYAHAAIVGALSWLVVSRLDFWPWVLALVLTHVVCDGLKGYAGERRLWPFVIDQLVHVGTLIAAACCYGGCSGWRQFAFVPAHYALQVPLFLCMVLGLTRPANLLVREIFLWDNAVLKPIEGSMVHAGAWIGALERLLTFGLVVLGNYQAVGFIMAAKSILRFKESEGPRAEYVLVGTLISVTIAFVLAEAFRFLSRI